MRKNGAFVAKIVNTGLTKIFMAIFAPDERLPSSATLIHRSLKPHSINYRVDAVHKEVHEYIQGRLKLLCKIHNISVGRTVTPLEIRI